MAESWRHESSPMDSPVRTYTFAGIPVSTDSLLGELPLSALRGRYRITGMERLPPAPAHAAAAGHHWRDAVGDVTLDGYRCGSGSCLAVPGVLQARMDGTAISVCAEPAADAAAVRHTLLNQVLPRVLDGAGELMLHAAAVADTGKPALLLLGATRHGKSTLGAAFASAGARLLGDDGVRLDVSGAIIRATPTYPSLRLRPDSHAVLHGDTLAASVAPEGDGAASGVAVGSIVVLNAPGADTGIRLERLAPGEAAMVIVQNSFALDPTDTVRAQRRLAQAAKVIATVPVHRITYPRDYARLPEVVARLRTLVPAKWATGDGA